MINLHKTHINVNWVNFTQTCGKSTFFDRVEFTHAFFKLSGNTRRIFTKVFEKLVTHYLPYLITFQKVPWINFYESYQKFSESA